MIIGLFLIGAIVASYTSRQVTRIVSKTLTMSIDDRLNSFSKYCIESEKNISYLGNSMRNIVDSKASKEIISKKASDTSLELRYFLVDLYATSHEFRNYVMKEDDKTLFFDIIPNTTLLYLISSIRDNLIEINNNIKLFQGIERKFDNQRIMESNNIKYTIDCVTNIKSILDTGLSLLNFFIFIQLNFSPYYDFQ